MLRTLRRCFADIGPDPDEWGGDTLVVPVSRLNKELASMISSRRCASAAEQRNCGEPQGQPSGITLEARSPVRIKKGTMATLLVLNGTLKRGDTVIAGQIRAG